jgi:hypothetical protein
VSPSGESEFYSAANCITFNKSMKKLLLPILGIVFLLCGATRLFSFPVYDPFNYTPGTTLWGQTDGNGDFWWEIDAGQVSPPNAIINTSVAVNYPGLPASAGNSIILSNLNGGQGARMFVNTNNTLYFFGNGAAGAPYPGPIEVLCSMVINITNMTSLSTSPVYVMGYNDQGAIATQGNNPGTMVYRIYFKSVNGTGTNYQIGISKQGAGPFFATNILNTFQNVLIVMDETITGCGVGEPNSCSSDIATLWVNPPSSSFGGNTEPAFSAQEGAGLDGNLTPYTSCFMFENRSTTTPNSLLVGQFRMGTNWSWVTGGPCYVNNNAATSNIYNTNFSLVVTGLDNGSLNTYQWQFNGTNLSNGPSISGSGSTIGGATTTNLVVTNSTGPDGGTYSLIVSNSVGSYTSVVSVVSVFQPQPPSIVTEPAPATVPLYPGGSDIVSFTTQGSPPITYYWYSNSVVVGVTTNVSAFTITNLQASATVYCLASNAFGSNTTSSTSIQLQSVPTAPYPLTVFNDKPIDFWPLNEHPDNGSGDTGTAAIDYMGGNDGYYSNANLTLPGYGTGLAAEFGYSPATDAETAAEFGYYPAFPASNSVIGGIQNINFTAPQDSPPFSVEAWVNANGNTPPSIGTIIAKGSGTQSTPGDQFSLDYASGNWQFYVRDASGIAFQVTGTATLDTNWHHIVGVMNTPIATLFLYVDGTLVDTNGFAFSNGTNTIGIENIAQPVTIGSAGSSLTVTNDKNWQGKINNVAIYGYALSATQVSNHFVAAGIPPEILVQPAGTTNIDPGGTVTASVVAKGSSPLSYQWMDVNASSPVAGQTNATIVLTNLTNSDSYYVQITNRYGTNNSQPIAVEVIYSPQIIQDITPINNYSVVGSTVSFSVSVDGASPINYSWLFNNGTNTVTLTNGGRFSGANSNVLTISDVQLSDAGTYQLSASNSYGGPANSSQASLSVAHILSFLDGVGDGFISESTPANALDWFAGGLYLTSNIGNEDTAAFYQSPVYIGGFEAAFNYQITSGSNSGAANGVTFCIQNDPRGAAAIGSPGSQLGVGSPSAITPSVELELNIYEANGIGGAGIAVATNGAIGTVHSTGSLAINSGDSIAVNLTYLHGVLTINLADSTASTQFTQTTNVNIPTLVGGKTAYVGFTGSDGASKSSQYITDFSFISIPSLTIQSTNSQSLISWTSSVGDYVLQQSSALFPSSWTTVTNGVTATNGQNQVTLSPGGSAKYYRLSLQ